MTGSAVAGLRATRLDTGPEQWDAFVHADPASTACHLAGWRSIMEDVLGHRYEAWVAVDAGGEARGVLPLVEVRSRLLGHYWLSMPFLNDGGPLGSTAARMRLEEAAVQRASTSGARLLELRTRQQTEGALHTSRRKLSVHLNLPADAEALWQTAFRAKLRSQIRRPIKEGLEARFGADQVSPFYEVFARNMRDLGTPVLPRRFFEALTRYLPRQVVFACIYHGDVPVAAGCGLLWNGEFEITWASSLREYNPWSPNMLLYWSLMRHAIEAGCTRFNFGRSTPGASTHRFKMQWGGYEVALPWSQWTPDGVAAAPPSPDRPIFQLATAAWRRLPLGVANRAGPVLARRLP